jgi:hypothetical protein
MPSAAAINSGLKDDVIITSIPVGVHNKFGTAEADKGRFASIVYLAARRSIKQRRLLESLAEAWEEKGDELNQGAGMIMSAF